MKSARNEALEAMIEAYLVYSRPGTWDMAVAAHTLLSGESIKTVVEDLKYDTSDKLRRYYPHLSRGLTAAEEEWAALIKDKPRPIAIYHDGDARAYYEATEEERAAWNAYAQQSADDFNRSPELDSYDSTSTVVGWNRDGKVTGWCPPLYFPEWLAKRKQS